MGKEAHQSRLSGEKTSYKSLEESLAGKTGGKNVGTPYALLDSIQGHGEIFPVHNTAHNVFMTRPPHTSSREKRARGSRSYNNVKAPTIEVLSEVGFL